MTTNWTKAIHEKQRIQLFYEPGMRVVEPHAFGRSSEGNLLVRAFQVDGASASGEHRDWKLFRVDRIGSSVSDGNFEGPRHGYKRGDKAMKGGIIAEL